MTKTIRVEDMTPAQRSLFRQLDDSVLWEAPKMTVKELEQVIDALYQAWGKRD